MSQNWIQHALRRSGWRPQRQAVALATLGLILALIVGALYLSRVASDATKNRELSELINLRNNLELTNEQLRAEIASLRTMQRLMSRAQELGFVEASNIEYLVIDGYNPERGQVISQVQDTAQPEAEYDETFGGWLQQQWDLLREQFQRFGSREEN